MSLAGKIHWGNGKKETQVNLGAHTTKQIAELRLKMYQLKWLEYFFLVGYKNVIHSNNLHNFYYANYISNLDELSYRKESTLTLHLRAYHTESAVYLCFGVFALLPATNSHADTGVSVVVRFMDFINTNAHLIVAFFFAVSSNCGFYNLTYIWLKFIMIHGFEYNCWAHSCKTPLSNRPIRW